MCVAQYIHLGNELSKTDTQITATYHKRATKMLKLNYWLDRKEEDEVKVKGCNNVKGFRSHH